MKKMLVLVATGFEDTELITTINLWNRAGIGYDLVSPENLKLVGGQNAALVRTIAMQDHKLTIADYAGIFLPGGKGHLILKDSQIVLDLVRDYHQQNKLVAAICAAPEVLLAAQVIGDHTYTSYPGFALGSKNTGKVVEIDRNMITGRDFEVTVDFANAVIDYLKK